MVSTVYIAKNVYGGDGLGRLGDGRVVFVPGAWAGEQVKAEIVEEKRQFVRARLVEIVERSPERQEPGGPVLPGMVYAALSPAGEQAAKEQQLREFFDRARLPFPLAATPPQTSKRPNPQTQDLPNTFHYRNKVVYHFARQKGVWAIGYRQEPSHDVIDVTEDPLARPEINARLPEIRRAVTTLLTTGPEAVRRDTAQKGHVTIRWTKKTGVKWWVGDAPKDLVLKETTCGLDFEVPADGFYQVNPDVGEALVASVVAAYEQGRAAAPDVLDLYCGVGVFGLCCKAPKLVGIESGRAAIAFAKRNAAAQRATDARFFSEQVGRAFRRLRIGPQTTVIVDPPRGGLEPNVAQGLANARAARIFYVSCDPATLVRDLRELTRTYDVASVRWFNMFPRTARFETFVTLVPCAGR